MAPRIVRSLIAPLRAAAGRFAQDPESRFTRYTDTHGCIRVAASHIAWNMLAGDYLEFGVWRGESVSEAYHAIEWHRRAVHAGNPRLHETEAFQHWWARPPRLIAFDSFEGLPASATAGQADYFEGSYACSEDEFHANLIAAGVPGSRISTVKGYYDQSLVPDLPKRLGLERAAIVMIDCDLYESTVPVLDFVTGLVQQGTIMIFHDWYRYGGDRGQGEQRAAAEWLARNPHLQLEPWWQEGPQAKAFLVHTRSPV